jgi:uncharacterized membrane protein YczE
MPARIGQLLVGLIVMSAGITALKQADLGLGPWDVLHDGIARHLGGDLGTVGFAVGIPILALWFPLRLRPGIGTIFNLTVMGWAIHVLLGATDEAHVAWLRVSLLVGGTLLVALGQGLYLTPELGAGPRDGLMTGLHRMFGWSIRLVRTLLEVAVLLVGMVLGGSVGVGTVVFALLIGPLVQVSLRAFGFATPAQLAAVGATPGDAIGLSGE